MASESVGANENSDLSASGRPRLGEYPKVYTRKFRRRAQLDRNSEEPATAATAAAEPPLAVASGTTEPTVSTSSAKSLICNDDAVTQTSPREAVAAKDGNFSQPPKGMQTQQLPSQSEVESSGSDPHLTEEGRDGPDDVQKSEVEGLQPGGPTSDLQPSGGQERVPNGLKEPTRSSGNQALPELQAPVGQERFPNGQEDPTRSSGNQDSPQLQASIGLERFPNGQEEPTSSSGNQASAQLQAPVGQERFLNGQEEPTRSSGNQASSRLQEPVGQERFPDGQEEPTRSSGNQVSPQLQAPVGQERSPDGQEEPMRSSGNEASPRLQAPVGQERFPDGQEEPTRSSGDQASPQPQAPVGQERSPDGREEPTRSGGNEASPQLQSPVGQERFPDGQEEPTRSGGNEASPQLQAPVGQERLPDGQEEPMRSSGNQASPQLQTAGGQEPIPDDKEPLSHGNGTPPTLQHTRGEQSLMDGTEEPASRSGQEAFSNGGEVCRPPGAQEVTVNCEEDLQPSGVQLDTSNGVEERQPLPNGREEPQLSNDDVPHSLGKERRVSDSAATALVNGRSKPVVTRVEDRLRINWSVSASKDDIRGVKRKLEGELDRVRNLVRKLETKELQFTAYNTSNTNTNANYVGGGFSSFGAYNQPQLMRVHSDIGSIGRPQLMRVNSEVCSVGRQETRPFRHLTVSVMDNNHGVGEFVEKEKRTPKANQYYRNSEFLLGKDRLPPENNKRLKPNGAGKKHGGEAEYGSGFGVDKSRDKMFRSCSNLLQRLMKHKHGWVFNEPVDAVKLCIPDYHDIIKHPMDFGTIKTRLSQNWYKSARDFAEDVRLVFRNAMTYNPKGQDVHTMAEELSKIFEERWTAIEKECFPYQMYYDAGLPIPTPRRAPPALPTPVLSPIPAPARSAPSMRALDRSESMTMPVDSKLKPNFHPPSRTPVPKKPKAKDPNKRDMTYEEKQKLSTNLQSLPSEKLDAIVQIIKKRNTALSQHDDEIEVDIDSVDAETLWELDRFVTNYKKSLSKNKRKAELAQARAEAALAGQTMNTTPAAANAQKESRIGENTNPSPVQVEKQGDNVSGSSSSSSSSSDSGSSSSDSDSDSSSAYGSDAGRSPRS